MNKGIHICIYSGHLKKGPQAPCPQCGRTPESEEDKARSLMLSTDYYLPESDYLGKSDEELLGIGEAIKNGQPYQFDEAEVRRLTDYAKEVAAITPRQLAGDLVRWLAGPLALLIGISILLYGRGRWF